jgi:transcriptional regulator of arginine metabolism
MSGGVDSLKSAVLQLLQGGHVETQEALVAQLQAQGFEVNQSKVSRMLRQLGAIKQARGQGRTVYVLPKDIPPPSTETEIARMVLEVDHNETLVVVHTAPGAASLIARLLDHQQKVLRIIGVIAGDDTIFLAPMPRAGVSSVATGVREFLLNQRSTEAFIKVH